MPHLAAPRLLSTINGAIENLLFSVPSWVFDRGFYSAADKKFIDGYLDVVRGIMLAATDHMAFTLLSHDSTRGRIKRWLVHHGFYDKARLVIVPNELRFTVWSSDMFLLGENRTDGTMQCIVPPEFPRSGDGKLAELLTHSGYFTLRPSSLFFQGGNILVGDDFYLIGADDPQTSLRTEAISLRKGESENDAVDRALRDGLDSRRKPHLIGARTPINHQRSKTVTIGGQEWNESQYFGNIAGTRQPIFHIDMFISMLGRSRKNGRFKLLVGDPGMAASLVGNTGWPDPMQDAFDDIALQLSERGFYVERNPLPLAFCENHEERTRVWYFASSNNVIVQDDPPVVWLPTYGYGTWRKLASTDAMNRAIWERHGYEVRMLPNCHPIASRHGGAHCITKCLARVIRRR